MKCQILFSRKNKKKYCQFVKADDAYLACQALFYLIYQSTGTDRHDQIVQTQIRQCRT